MNNKQNSPVSTSPAEKRVQEACTMHERFHSEKAYHPKYQADIKLWQQLGKLILEMSHMLQQLQQITSWGKVHQWHQRFKEDN
jgi:hypothetical protein